MPGRSERNSRPSSRVSAVRSAPSISVSAGRPAGQLRAMLPLRLLTAALFLVRCSRGNGIDILPAPTNVRFLAETFRHLLHWEPGPRPMNLPAELFYDVQYQQYGSGTWTPAPNCTRISGSPCDLSLQTGRPKVFYYARVRAVAGGSASNWTQTLRFSPKEVLHLLNVSLSLHGNTIRVSVRPTVGQGANLSFQDLYLQWSEFHAQVRRSSDNRQFVHVGSSLEFDLPSLSWGQRYCVRVQLRVFSWPLPAKPTEEQCVSIPALPGEEDHLAVLVSPSLSLLTLVPLWVFAFGFSLAWAYVKKPMEMPGMLTSLPKKDPSPEGPSEERLPGLQGLEEVILRVEREPIQPLCFLGLHLPVGNSERPVDLATPPLGKSCWMLGWRAESPGLWKNILDSSRGSTDSGICLQDPSDNLGFFLDTWKLSLGSRERDGGFDAGGLRSEEQLPPMVSETKESLPLSEPPKTCFSTYLSQSGATLEVASGTGQVTLVEPGMVNGYLKQASLGIVLPAKDLMELTPASVLPSHPPAFRVLPSGLLQNTSSPA